MISVLDVAALTRQVKQMLEAAPTLEGVPVERGCDPDTMGDYLGWVGIYRSSVNYPPRALGAGAGSRRQLVRLILLVSMSHPLSGENCEDDLEALVKKVIDVLLSDTSLGGLVDTLDEDLSVQYDSYDKVDTVYKQRALVFLTGVLQVS